MIPTEENRKAWQKWVKSRPQNVQEVAERFPPWKNYYLGSTGQRCTIYSFSEHDDGSVTITVDVTADLNLLCIERRVFGVDPNNLTPCEGPTPAQQVGILYVYEL